MQLHVVKLEMRSFAQNACLDTFTLSEVYKKKENSEKEKMQDGATDASYFRNTPQRITYVK